MTAPSSASSAHAYTDDFPADRTLPQLIAEQAQRTPHAIAVEFEGKEVTYEELLSRADALATRLRGLGVGPEVLVGICLERGVEMVVAILATLRAGGAYVPIEPDLPVERIATICEDIGSPPFVTESRFLDRVPGHAGRIVCLDVPQQHHADAAVASLRGGAQAGPDNLAYVIFTSGSTGRPKGVLNVHRGLMNRIWWMQREYRLGPSDVVLQKTPYGFDVSVWEFVWPLMVGAKLVVAKPGGHRDAGYLTSIVRERGVTTLHFVPSMLRYFVDAQGVADCTSIRRVICSGEALPYPLAQQFLQVLPGAELHNLYGPTEASIDVTYWQCKASDPGPTVPIGRPIANTQIHILGEGDAPLGVGEPGELVIGGVGVARGYLNRPDLTASRFVPDPFSKRPGATMYRTGDLASRRPDGAIEYLGRIDHQVKLRGFRIELGEIETTLALHPDIREAAVVLREHPTTGDKRLVAYVTHREGRPTEQDVRQFLRRKLPEYMVPSAVVFLDALPLSQNGKLDRKALPSWRPTIETTAQAESPVEEELARIWKELLHLPTVGIHDDFFALGGHSLLVMQLISRVRRAFDRQLQLHAVFSNPTIAGIAKLLGQGGAESTAPGGRLLADDIELEERISGERFRAPSTDPPQEVFLTGASGFLGAYLLHALLERTAARIHCLVRATGEAEARARLRDNLARRGLWSDAYEKRVIPVIGDLALSRFGLSEDDFETLAIEIDTILHNGAMVDFVRPYAVLRDANVGGTVEALRLATTSRLKPMHYVSTLSVFPPRPGGEDRIELEQDPLGFPGELLFGGYPQSKWVADRIVMLARTRGIPASIYRPGMILGSSHTGESNTADFYHRLVKGSIELGLSPDVGVRLNLNTADFVGPAIVDMALRPETWGGTFHLVNPVALPWNILFGWVDSLGWPIRTVDYDEWVAGLRDAVDRGEPNALAPLVYFISELPRDAFSLPWFDDAATQQALDGRGIECPASPELLEVWFQYLVRCGFLRPPG